MTDALWRLTATELAAKIAAKEVSAKEHEPIRDQDGDQRSKNSKAVGQNQRES